MRKRGTMMRTSTHLRETANIGRDFCFYDSFSREDRAGFFTGGFASGLLLLDCDFRRFSAARAAAFSTRDFAARRSFVEKTGRGSPLAGRGSVTEASSVQLSPLERC